MVEYLVVTGMSGAGRSNAAATLEDLGFFVIDNLPTALIGRVAELANREGSSQRICFVVGRGGPDSVSDLLPILAGLRAGGARVRLLFLDASDETLVRRFEGTRRRHPLEGGGVLDAIVAERALLEEIRQAADLVIDTSATTVNDLRMRLLDLFSDEGAETMETVIVSFGYKHGLPLDVDIVLDCRFLPNPYWVESLREHSGLDKDVKDYVLSFPETSEFLERLGELFSFLLPAYAREGKAYLSVAIGCTGGRHRSVVLAEELAARFAAAGHEPSVHHRDVDR